MELFSGLVAAVYRGPHHDDQLMLSQLVFIPLAPIYIYTSTFIMFKYFLSFFSIYIPVAFVLSVPSLCMIKYPGSFIIQPSIVQFIFIFS